MLFLLLYFIYLWIVSIVTGWSISKCIFKERPTILHLILTGVATNVFIFSTLPIWTPLNQIVANFYHLALMVLLFWFRKPLFILHKEMVRNILKIPNQFKIVLFSWTILVLLGAAMPPFLIDNETYYLQSIRWLNEAGFVKGLANLHPFLGQMSGWHALEAGLNVHVLGRTSNDLNGFLFLIISVAMLIKSQNKQLFIGLLLMLFLFLWWVVSSPSPDGPLLLITFYITFFLLTTKNETLRNPDHQVFLGLIISMLLLIKITAVPLLGYLLLFKWRKKQGLWMFMILTIAGMLWIIKNDIISGWLLYPFPWLTNDRLWTLPEAFYRFEQENVTKSISFFGNVSWVLLIVLIGMLWLWFKTKQRKVKTVILVGSVQIGICFLSQVTLRLALPGIIIFVVVGLYLLTKEKKTKTENWQRGLVVVSAFILLGLNVFPVKMNNAKIAHGGKPMTIEGLFLPHQNTRFPEMKFVKKKAGNLEYFSPEKEFLLFNTFNGPLPAVNHRQIEYFKNRFHIIPQNIGNSHSDGFYSQKVE